MQENVDNINELANEVVECEYLITLDRGRTFLGKQVLGDNEQQIKHQQIEKADRKVMNQQMLKTIAKLVTSEPDGTKVTVAITEVSISGSQAEDVIKNIVIPLAQVFSQLEFKML
ncbi:MAG: hypothetical protein ACPG8W_09275 [Candidatus Promineifilaceae bacterium]